MSENTDKPPFTSTEDEQLQDNVSSVKNLWLLGATIALIPVCIIIYFIFFWGQSADQDSTGAADQPFVSRFPQDIYPPASPDFSEAPTKDIPQEKIDSFQARQPQTTPVEQTAPTAASPKVEAPAVVFSLPSLDQSDTAALDDLSALSPLLEWYIWLYTDEVVRKFVTVVDNLARGKVATKFISIPRPDQPFQALAQNNALYINPQSYQRFQVYANLFDSFNEDELIQIYWRYQPLMEEAYRELGYPDDRNFHNTLLNAIDNLLETPILDKPIKLTHLTPVLFRFDNPNLEALPSAHKLLIRMGPRNSLVILRKLERLRQRLKTAPATATTTPANS